MKTYTVILMRPDWACNFPHDTFMESCEAGNPTEALAKVRAMAMEIDGLDEEEGDDPTDYFCIAVIEGDHNDLNPEN